MSKLLNNPVVVKKGRVLKGHNYVVVNKAGQRVTVKSNKGERSGDLIAESLKRGSDYNKSKANEQVVTEPAPQVLSQPAEQPVAPAVKEAVPNISTGVTYVNEQGQYFTVSPQVSAVIQKSKQEEQYGSRSGVNSWEANSGGGGSLGVSSYVQATKSTGRSQESIMKTDTRINPKLFEIATATKQNYLVADKRYFTGDTLADVKESGGEYVIQEAKKAEYQAKYKTDEPIKKIGLNLAAFSGGLVGGATELVTHPIRTVKSWVVDNPAANVAADVPILFKGGGLPNTATMVSEFSNDLSTNVGVLTGQAAVIGTTEAFVKKIPYYAQQYNPNSPFKIRELAQGFEPHKGTFNQWLLEYQGETITRAGKTYGIRRASSFDIKKPATYYDAVARTITRNPKYEPGRIKNFDPIGENILLRDTPSQFATPLQEAQITGTQFIASAKSDVGYIKQAFTDTGEIKVLPGGGQALQELKGRAATGGLELGEFYAPRTIRDIDAGGVFIPKGTAQIYTYYSGVGRGGYLDLLRGEATFSFTKPTPGVVIGQETISIAKSGSGYVKLAQELGYSPGKTQQSASTLRNIRSEAEVVKSLETPSKITRQFDNIYFSSGEKLNVFVTRNLPLTKSRAITAYSNLIDFSKGRIEEVKGLILFDSSLTKIGTSIIETEKANIRYVSSKLSELTGDPANNIIIKKGLVNDELKPSSVTVNSGLPKYLESESLISSSQSAFKYSPSITAYTTGSLVVPSVFGESSVSSSITSGGLVPSSSIPATSSSFVSSVVSISGGSVSTPVSSVIDNFSSVNYSSSSGKSSGKGKSNFSDVVSGGSVSTPVSSVSTGGSISSITSTSNSRGGGSGGGGSSGSISYGSSRITPSQKPPISSSYYNSNSYKKEKLYSAYARVKGRFTLLTTNKSKKYAELAARTFVENRPAATLKITRSTSNRGLDLSGFGSFKKKRSSKEGVIFIEPSSRRINTAGEVSQISYKGVESQRNKGGLKWF